MRTPAPALLASPYRRRGARSLSRQPSNPAWPLRRPSALPGSLVAEATRVIAPKFLMVQLLAQKAGLDDKVKVFVLYVEPITDMIDRSLKADAH